MAAKKDPIGQLQKKLTQFLSNHPRSKVGKLESPINCLAILEPWGDATIALVLDSAPEQLFLALNNTLLPERFTALYHPKTSYLEVIYTTYPILGAVKGRKFEFIHLNEKHICEFRRSSDILLDIAAAFLPIRPPSDTRFRNLSSFKSYAANTRSTAGLKGPKGEPTSFWISNVQWNEDKILDLVNHLNFYMTYFDADSPRIMIHSPESETSNKTPQTRFAFGDFPKTIKSRGLDDVLLHFWYATLDVDPARTFLYSYQILEYAAYYHLDDGIRRKIIKELVSPNALDNISSITDKVVDIISEFKMQDIHKMESVIKNCVNFELVWREIERNIQIFSQPIKFDGGFAIPELIRSGARPEDFQLKWASSFTSTIRQIRNGLSHAKEERMATVITPTKANFRKLQPWVNLISIAASEVIIYRGIN